MNRFIVLVTAAIAVAALCIPAAAQRMGGTGPAGGNPGEVSNHMGQNNMTQDQFNKLQDYVDVSKRLTGEDKAKGKTVADLVKEDKANATELVKTLPLSCDLTDAVLAAQGPASVNGKSVDTKTYEVACGNGMGYFLVTQAPEKPYGFSCFAAEATRAADVAQGKPPGTVCQLAANASVKAMMTTVISRAGTNCQVRDFRWVGTSSASNTEFTEVACSDDTGYILKTAMPGSTQPPRAINCHDAAIQGLPCKLTIVPGAFVPTVQTFKDALAQYKVSCDAPNVRVVGQENVLKRYVVEFQCPQQPKGLVAFIPLNGNTAKFETLDCKAATKKGVTCQLTK